MPTTTKAAASHTAVTTGWTNPTNAYQTAGDNTYATAAPAKNSTIDGDFFLANIAAADIPDGARIVKALATVEWYMSAAVTGGTLGVQQYIGGTAAGTETTNTAKTSSGAEGQDTQSITAIISIADVRSASTKIAARVRATKGNTTNAMTANLDLVKFDIDWIPSTLGLLGC